MVLNCLSINAPSPTHAPNLKYPFNKGGNDLNILLIFKSFFWQYFNLILFGGKALGRIDSGDR